MTSDNADIEFFVDTGTVKGSTVWSETSVHGFSSGGGGYLQNGTGYIHAPSTQISSHAQERSRYFLCLADDKERECRDAVSAADGQRVSILTFSRRGGDKRYCVGTLNRNTAAFKPSNELDIYLADVGLRPRLENPFGLNRDTVMAGLVGMAIFVAGAVINGPTVANLLVAIAVGFGMRYYVKSRYNAARSVTLREGDKLRQSIVERGRAYLETA